MLKSRKKRFLAFGSAASLLTVAGIVAADTYPGTNDGTGADNRNHWGCWVPNPGGAIPAPLWDHLFSYMGVIQSQINFTVYWDNPCNSATDMWLDNRLSDPTVLGQRFCAKYNGNGDCDRNSVMQNPTTVASSSASAGVTFAVGSQHDWCHEIGHSMGLGHKTGDCLESNAMSVTTYDAHHRSHLLNDFNL